MPRLAVLSQYTRLLDSPSPRSAPSSPAAGTSSPRSVSPSSPRSPLPSSRQSAFSLVCPRDVHRSKDYLNAREMGVLMYGSSLGSLMPVGYPPYVWHHLPGLFIPYSPLQRALSPERVINAEQGYTPEKAKVGKFKKSIKIDFLNQVKFMIVLECDYINSIL